jgi:MFS family permease
VAKNLSFENKIFCEIIDPKSKERMKKIMIKIDDAGFSGACNAEDRQPQKKCREKYASSDKNNIIWNPTFISAFVVSQSVHLCTQMMNTLTAKYADYMNAPAPMIGFATGIFALTALVFKMISAPALDTYNRKYIVMGATGVIFLAFVCYTLSFNVQMLIFSRLLQGAGQAFTTTGCLTIASDSLPPDKMSSGIGYFALTSAIAQAISPAIGLKLIGIVGYNTTFAILAGVMVIAIINASRLKIDFVRTNKFTIRMDSIIAKECLAPAFILFLLSMTFCVVHSFLVLYAEGKGIGSNIGYFFTVYAATMIFTRPSIGKLADRFGTVKVMLPSLVFFAFSFMLISFSHTLFMFLLSGFISAFGFGGCQPAIQAVAMRSVPKERRGAASCTSYIGNDMGNLVGPTVAGFVVQNFGYVSMWRIMIVPIFIGMLVTILFRRKIDKDGIKA